jgi:hypothetical protein
MNDRINSSVRRPLRWALLPAIATIGVLAGLSNAFAYDQQATDDAVNNAQNWQAAHGAIVSGPHAQSYDEDRTYAPRYRGYR